ncbi:MAG: hypothetical protein ACXU9U_01460 [Parachlamydiaceae bacterium]
MTILKYTFFSLLFLFLPIQNIHSGENSVAFLGESYSSENDETGIHEEILSRLFSLIQKQSPSAGVTANFQGLDVHSSQRDLFWRILMKHKVTAYFCAQEHLYDRTNRQGVWQIISGGAGAPLYKWDFDKAFYHYVRLILPHQNQLLPKIQVFDIQGNFIDEIELAPSHYPVYQLRIS